MRTSTLTHTHTVVQLVQLAVLASPYITLPSLLICLPKRVEAINYNCWLITTPRKVCVWVRHWGALIVHSYLFSFIFSLFSSSFSFYSVLYILIGLKLRASSRSSTGVRRPSSKRVNETASTKKSKSKGSKSSSSVLKSGGGGQYSSSDGKNNNYSSSGSGNGSRPLSMSIRRQNNSRRAVIKMLGEQFVIDWLLKVLLIFNFFLSQCSGCRHCLFLLLLALSRPAGDGRRFWPIGSECSGH